MTYQELAHRIADNDCEIAFATFYNRHRRWIFRKAIGMLHCPLDADMTYAEPGQGGVGHINLQEADYWIQWMGTHGFEMDQPLTTIIREKAKHVHFKTRGMVFRRIPAGIQGTSMTAGDPGRNLANYKVT